MSDVSDMLGDVLNGDLERVVAGRCLNVSREYRAVLSESDGIDRLSFKLPLGVGVGSEHTGSLIVLGELYDLFDPYIAVVLFGGNFVGVRLIISSLISERPQVIGHVTLVRIRFGVVVVEADITSGFFTRFKIGMERDLIRPHKVRATADSILNDHRPYTALGVVARAIELAGSKSISCSIVEREFRGTPDLLAVRG